jgi:mono/diheme cytochrome c family protein
MRGSVVVLCCAAVAVTFAGGCRNKEEKAPAAVTVVVPAAVPGPLVEMGAKVFHEKCAACHLVNGVGGRVGPDLSKIASTRDALYLQTQMQDPSAYKKDTKMPAFRDMPKPEKDALIEYLLTLK